MNTELVETLAREAGIPDPAAGPHAVGSGTMSAELQRFAALVAEECARICLGPHGEFGPPNYTQGVRDGAAGCANMIRKRFSIDAPQQEEG